MMNQKQSVEKTVRDIRRATCKRYSVEEKSRIVLAGLRGEDSIAELCRRRAEHQSTPTDQAKHHGSTSAITL